MCHRKKYYCRKSLSGGVLALSILKYFLKVTRGEAGRRKIIPDLREYITSGSFGSRGNAYSHEFRTLFEILVWVKKWGEAESKKLPPEIMVEWTAIALDRRETVVVAGDRKKVVVSVNVWDNT